MADIEKSVAKGLSGSGVVEDSNMVAVDVKNGKIQTRKTRRRKEP